MRSPHIGELFQIGLVSADTGYQLVLYGSELDLDYILAGINDVIGFICLRFYRSRWLFYGWAVLL